MISSFLIIAITISYILFPPSTVSIGKYNDWDIENIIQEEETEAGPSFEINNERHEEYKKTTPPDVQNVSLDLDGNNINEEIIIKSYPGFPGDQNTKIYINSSPQSVLTEVGDFYALNVHKMNNSKNYVTELQLQTGQSLNTIFYRYENEKLERVSVSTEKSPSWHGVISRNIPEFKDIDNDGSLELLAYYNFLYDSTRTVEVYEYAGLAFNLVQKYEEKTPTEYFN